MDRISSSVIKHLKELFYLVKINNFYSLFFSSTNNPYIQFFRYIFVGGSAFIADAGILFVLSVLGLHYLIAAIFANGVGLVINYILSKAVVFAQDSKHFGHLGEFTVYGIIGLIGLILNESFMYFFTDKLGIYFMLSKIISAVIILFWNFVARKFLLYM